MGGNLNSEVDKKDDEIREITPESVKGRVYPKNLNRNDIIRFSS